MKLFGYTIIKTETIWELESESSKHKALKEYIKENHDLEISSFEIMEWILEKSAGGLNKRLDTLAFNELNK